MPAKKAHSRKSVRSVPAAKGQGATRALFRQTTHLEAIVVDKRVWQSMKSHDAQALRKVADWISEARAAAGNKPPGVRLVVEMDPLRRVPRFEVEDLANPNREVAYDLENALLEARERGVSRAVEILSGTEMLSAADFAKFIGVSREAVRAKHQRNEVLGLKGAKRGLRFPKWQVTSDGGLLPKLPRFFEILGGESWTVYRFLIQHHPELEGDTALSALLGGKIEKALAAAENTAGAFS
jgi:hypothetical protein